MASVNELTLGTVVTVTAKYKYGYQGIITTIYPKGLLADYIVYHIEYLGSNSKSVKSGQFAADQLEVNQPLTTKLKENNHEKPN
jgi:hypothetical protein